MNATATVTELRPASSNSEVADVSSIFRDLFSGHDKINNAQSRFVLFMFTNEVSFSEKWARRVLNASGKRGAVTSRRSLLIDTITQLDPEGVGKMIAEVNAHNALTSDEKGAMTRNQKQVLATYGTKINTAVSMAERAVRCLFYFRHLGTKSITVRKDGSFSFINPDGDPDVISGRAAATAGSRAFAGPKAKGTAGKKGASAAERLSTKEVIGTASTLIAYIEAIEKRADSKGDAPTFTGDEEKAFDDLLLTLLTRKFAADGKIESADLDNYAKAHGLSIVKDANATANKASAPKRNASARKAS